MPGSSIAGRPIASASLYRDDRQHGEGTALLLQEHRDHGHEARFRLDLDGLRDDPCGVLRDFHRAIRDGEPMYPDALDLARAVAPVFAAERSARTGCPARRSGPGSIETGAVSRRASSCAPAAGTDR